MIPKRLPGIGGLLRRVALEPRPDEVLWAESFRTPAGRRLRAWGREPRPEDEAVEAFLARLAATPWLRHAEVAIPIRHPELTLERLALPALSNRDASQVAGRRLAKALQVPVEPANGGVLLASGSGERVAWLASCPREFAGFAEQRWKRQGLPVSYFGHAHLALGGLTQVVDAPSGGGLHVFLDVGADHGTCVVADSHGWVFSREFPIKLSRTRSPIELGSDPLERLATELRRTFQYVETELRIGAVDRVVLSGVREDLGELTTELGARLGLPVVALGEAAAGGPAAGIDAALGPVLGLALEPVLGDANLLPRPSIREGRRVRAQRVLASTLAVPALALPIVAAHVYTGLQSLSERSEGLEAEWEATEIDRVEAEALSQERARAEMARDARRALSQARPAWSGGLESLGRILPDDAFTTALAADLDESGWSAKLDLEFRGDDLARAAEEGSRFAERLDASPLWAVRGVSRGAGVAAPVAPGGPTAVRSHIRVDAWLAPVVDEARHEPEVAPGQEALGHG